MKHASLALLGMATLLSAPACHKTAPGASKPADTTPVASAPAERQAQPLQQRQTASAPAETPQAPRPERMTPQERATLNEKLAHLNDALFDYDKSVIRDDASTVLK